jgi:hydroxymethylpyrimidine/phosphomethylpyrimidine kinase
LTETATDLYGGNGHAEGELHSEFTKDVNSHGSGCTFASAVAAGLAKGLEIETALKEAKKFISGSLKHNLKLENDIHLIDHFWQKT